MLRDWNNEWFLYIFVLLCSERTKMLRRWLRDKMFATQHEDLSLASQDSCKKMGVQSEGWSSLASQPNHVDKLQVQGEPLSQK